MRSLTPAVQHVQPGSKLTLINDAPDREELYAIQWLERIEEGTEVVANASTAALEMIAAEGTVDNCFLACYGLRGTSTDLPTYFAECPTKESRIEAVCAILGNPKTLTMLVEKIHPRYGTRDKLRASYQFRLGLFQLWRAVQEAKRRAAETLQAP